MFGKILCVFWKFALSLDLRSMTKRETKERSDDERRPLTFVGAVAKSVANSGGRERETFWRRVQNNFIYYTRRYVFEKGGE